MLKIFAAGRKIGCCVSTVLQLYVYDAPIVPVMTSTFIMLTIVFTIEFVDLALKRN